jgi:Leucine-rich repeat (LRR) protein
LSTTLTTLNLSRNALLVLPQAIGSLTMLQELNLSRNRLRVLPKEIGALKHLTTLNVLSNNLRPHARSLPLEELANLPMLRVLDLRFNEVFLHFCVSSIFTYLTLTFWPNFGSHVCVM